jgi:hypothetical protein
MTTSNIFNDISSIYLEEVFKPQLGKSAEAPKKAGAPAAGGPRQSGEEGSAKRVRQAVYDIRYRARREDVPLEQAFNQYMSNTSMNAVEKKEVKEKLGIGPGGKASAPVKEENEVNESEDQKYQVRVTDKLTGKSYVRMATREKINQLRANKNIASVEMTKYGSPYEGEKKKGKQTASVTSGKGLDPVGKEDADVDNDGKKNDPNDKYIMNRRKAIGNAMSKRKTVSSSYEMNGKMVEGFSNWREDLREVVSDDIAFEKKNEVKEKKVNNYNGKDKCINLTPKIEEAVEEIGGHLIESVELDEQFIVESVQTASEYFFNEGLNEYGVDLLIEDLGLDAFVEFVFELSGDSVLSEKVETRLQKKAGAPLKGPKGSKVQSSTNAALKKHGLTRKIDGDAPSSTIKKSRKAEPKEEPKAEVKASVEKAKESQPKKRPVLDAIARQVNAGVKRHQAAMSAARETGKTIGKAASGAGKVAKEFGKGVSGATKLAARLVRGEEFENVLDDLTNAELYFLSNELIEEVVEEVFFECIEEGYEVDEIEDILTESLDTSLESFLVEGDRYDSAVATSKKNAKLVAKNKTVQRRAERTQKVKDTVKSVADRVRSAGKKAVYGAGYAAGKAVSTAKKAGEAAAAAGRKAGEAAASAGSKAKEVAKKVSDTAKAGYAAGKGSDSDSDSGSSKSSGSYRIKYKTASKKKSKEPGMLSKIGSALKSGLKKAIGKSARAVSRGARNVARRMDEEVELQEKITAKTDMGAAIRDFYGSDSPQLAGRTKEERRKAAIAAVLTARRGGKKLGEAVTQMPGRETTPPSGTTAQQDDIQRKQMINNRQKMLMKQQMLQKQKLAQQKKGSYPMEQMDQNQQQSGGQQQNNADDKKAEMLRKQQMANRQKMIQKKQMLQRQELALQKQGKLPMETEEFVSELNRYEKETGKDYKTGKPSVKGGTAKDDKAFQMVSKIMGSSRMGVQPRGKKKVPGQKPPTAGSYGAPASPAQKVAKRRAAAQRSQDNMSSRFD